MSKLDQSTIIMAATVTLFASVAEACPVEFNSPAELLRNRSWFDPLLNCAKPFDHPGMQQVYRHLHIWTSIVEHVVYTTPMAPAFDPTTYTPPLLQDIHDLLGKEAPYKHEDYTKVLNMMLGKFIMRCYTAYGALVLYRMGKSTQHMHMLTDVMYRATVTDAKEVLVAGTLVANMVEHMGTQTEQPYPILAHRLSVEEIEAQVVHLNQLANTPVPQSGWAPMKETPYA